MEEKENDKSKIDNSSKNNTGKSSEYNIDDILKKILTSRK